MRARKSSGREMANFWDDRAAEDPFFFVDDRQPYRAPDRERFWAGGREALEGVLALLEIEIDAGDEVVEIGCGVGRITRALCEQDAFVRAIDVSPRMLAVARELNRPLENVRWLLGDGRTLGLIDSASADVCYSYVVFQHIPDPEITLGYVREMGRVLRPGGWAAFQVSNDDTPHRRRSLRERAPRQLLSLLGRAPRGQAHRAWLGSATDLRRLAKVASESAMYVERVVGEGTQHCHVLLRRT